MKRIEKLIEAVKPYYQKNTDPAHDWPHITRVAACALKLASLENADVASTLAAVYCHDLVNLPKDHPDRIKSSALAAGEARPLLEQAGFNAEEIKKIQSAVVEHSYSKGLRPTTIEGAVVQDADRLDALGAIGILRCAAVCALMKSRFYDANEPLAKNRELDDRAFMLDHYFVKLFKLPDLMNTEAAKSEGLQRVEYMRSFMEKLLSEIA